MMTYDELLQHNKKRKIVQIGIVTSDIHKTMKDWTEKLDVGPWRYKLLDEKSITNATEFLDGETKDVNVPFAFYNALTEIGDLQIELIQPLYGPTIYQEFMDRKGEGLHHIKEGIAVEDWEDHVEKMVSRGMKVTQSGRINKAAFAYFNTEPVIDVIIEASKEPKDNTYPAGVEVKYYPEKED